MFEKIIFVTGFLGSGKTYFINELLNQRQQNQRQQNHWGLIVNDFGKQNIDMALLQNISGGLPAYPISNGCICCSAKEGLDTALKYLKTQGIKNIIIEASGLFMGADIIETSSFTKDLIVACLLDGRDILHNKVMSLEAKIQIKAAGALILSHMDKLDGLGRAEVQSKASIYNEKSVILINNQNALWTHLFAIKNDHTKGEQHHHHSSVMECNIKIPHLRNQNDLEYLTYILSHGQFGQIIRAKGFVKVGDDYYLLQLTTHEFNAIPIDLSDDIVNILGILSVFGYQLKADMLNSAINKIV